MEKILTITFILVAIVAIPIGIYFLIKSELRKRSLYLLEIIVVILLAVILWFAAIEGLRSNTDHFYKVLFFVIFLVFPIMSFYGEKIRDRKEGNFGLILFFMLITCPSILFLLHMSNSQAYPQDMPTLHIDEPFKVWHALYLFILAWFIKHWFYGEKEERTIKIAPLIWCRKNLDVSTYRNGDAIPQVQDAAKWANLETGAWCYYENKSDNGIIYGKLYNFYAVNDPRGLAPIGYYIPSGDDWAALINSIMAKENFKGKQMKSESGWENNGNGNNSSGFAGLPGGFRDSTGDFKDIGAKGRWWRSDGSISYSLFANDGNVHLKIDEIKIGFSVRCLKD